VTPHEEMLASIRNDLMIALIRRLAGYGELMIPASELEASNGEKLMLRYDKARGSYIFFVERKPKNESARGT
jgi:hypothetical protein